MKFIIHISLIALTKLALPAADVVTIDPSGTVIIAGTAPATAAAGEVRLGAGQIKTEGTVNAGDVTINRTTQASGNQAVRGDDPRMVNSRTASGGDAATVGGKAPSAFVAAAEKGQANGVATLDTNGRIPAAQLPIVDSTSTALCWSTPGTFTWTVPADGTIYRITLVGGGSSGMYSPAIYSIPVGSFGGYGGEAIERTVAFAPGTVVTITVGIGGAGGGIPTAYRTGSSSLITTPGGIYVLAHGGAMSETVGSTTVMYGTKGKFIYRSSIGSSPVGPGGAAGGMGIGPGGAEVAGGMAGLTGTLGGGGSGPSTLNEAGAGGAGCVLIQKLSMVNAVP